MANSFIEKNENLPVARKYIFKVLEAGEKYYNPAESNRGTIVLTEEMMMDLTNDLIGKSIIIGHVKIKDSNIDDNANIVVGRIIRAFQNTEGFTTADGTFYEPDNASYVEGYIDKQTGVDYIEKGYRPSIFYTITEEQVSKNKTLVKAGESNHLGLVENPKYDTAIYTHDLITNQRMNMSNNATTIANGTMPMPSQVENNEMEMEKEEDTDFKDTYYKDGEEEFSLEEMWNSIGEEMEKQASKKYYDKDTFVKNGKTYNIKNMCDMYKSKKQVKNEVSLEEKSEDSVLNSSKGAEKPEEKSEDIKKENEVANSRQDQTLDLSQAGNSEGFFNKVKNAFKTQPEAHRVEGGLYKNK
jgi:hypothetical protein